MRSLVEQIVQEILEGSGTLLEDKVSSLKEKIPEQTELIDFFASKDPTGKQKYLEWALKRTLQGNESKELVVDAFLKFDQIGPRLEKKDINQYESAERVFDAINYYETVQRSERSKGKEKKKTAYKAAESGEGEKVPTKASHLSLEEIILQEVLKHKVDEMALSNLESVDDPFAEELISALRKGKKTAVVYHGTSTKHFWSIIKNGFVFSPERKNWEGTSPGTYFSFNIRRAAEYTLKPVEKAGGEAIIFVLELPLKELERDLDDSDAWDKNTHFQSVVRKEIQPRMITGVIYPVRPFESGETPETPIKKFIAQVQNGKIKEIPPDEEGTEGRFKKATPEEIEWAVVQYVQDLIQYTSFDMHNFGQEGVKLNSLVLRKVVEEGWPKISAWTGEDWVKYLESVYKKKNEEEYYKEQREFTVPLWRVIKKYTADIEAFNKFRLGKTK